MSKGDTPHTAAEIRSLVDQAEAEAAEAEALAAAARARARAIQLRREADRAEDDKQAKIVADDPISAEPAVAVADARPSTDKTESVAPKVRRKPKLIKTKPVNEPAAGVAVDEPESQTPRGSREVGDKSAQSTQAASEPDEATAEEDVLERTPEEAPADTRWLRRPKWSAVAAVLAIVVSFAALGASVEMAVLDKNAKRERQLVAEYSAAARQGVVTLTSLDFEHAKEGVQNILEVSTGTFKDDFLKMAGDFAKVVEESKVVSQGSVQAAAVDLDSLTDNSAMVLVSSTSEVTNAAGAKQDPRKYRLIVTVTREGGQLKMSNVAFVP